MKVLLVAPYRPPLESSTDTSYKLPSEALLILYAVLRQAGHEPIMRNYTNNVVEKKPDPKKFSHDDIKEILDKEQPPIVGLTCLFSGDFPFVIDLAKMIKKHSPNVKIITGGIHATTYPNEILSNLPEFDYVVLGEGERQLIEIVNRLEKSDLGNLEDIAGFAFRDEKGKVKINTKQELVDYENLPMPAWDQLDFSEYEIDLSNYYNPKKHNIKNVVSVFSERGCPFKCTFCDLYMIQGRKLRRLHPASFVGKLEYLVNEKNQRYFTIQDDNFIVDNRHVINICNEIVRRGLDIQFDIAGGYVNSYNDDVVVALAEAGMVSTILNIEHGNEYMRNEIIKKAITHEKIFHVVESIRKHNVQIGTNWIMGFPEETNDTLQDTYNMIEQIKPDRAAVGVLTPYPSTPIFEQCFRDDLFVDKTIKRDQFWNNSFRPHQDKPIIKPYNMTTDELLVWKQKFVEIKYKYFGHYNKEFKIPAGYSRNEKGIVVRDQSEAANLSQ